MFSPSKTVFRPWLLLGLWLAILSPWPAFAGEATELSALEIKQMVEVLKHGDRQAKDRVAGRLAFHQSKRVLPHLEMMLEPLSPQHHRVTASWVLGLLRMRVTAGILVRTLGRDEDWEVRRNAAFALGAIGGALRKNSASQKALTGALRKDDNPRVRAQAALSLAQCRMPKATSELGKALGDEAPRVRAAASQALSSLGKAKKQRRRLRALALKDPEREVREAATLALTGAGDDAAFEAGRALLSSGTVRRQREWIQALGQQSGAGRAAGHLLPPLLKDAERSLRLRVDAAVALARHDHEAGLRMLVLRASDEDLEVQGEALRGLRELEIGDARREALHRRFASAEAGPSPR